VNARDEVLTRIRAGRVPASPRASRAYRRAGSRPADLAQLADRLRDYHATVHKTTPVDLPDQIRACLAPSSVVLCPPGVPAEWTARFSVLTDEPPLSIDRLDEVDTVITGCALAISETGTIVLDHGSGQGRRALTLVPDHHVVVVREDQVVAGVPDAIAALPPGVVQTWISGPSATSDIELNRVEGVHGPRRLDVVIVSLGATSPTRDGQVDRV
jgi:L-lactate dehydrogenase complex protein LldG